jgi:hypothetical protein
MKTKKYSSSFFVIVLILQIVPLFLSSCLDYCSGQAINYRIKGLTGEALEYISSTPSWQSKPWSNSNNLNTEKLILAFVTDTELLGAQFSNFGLPVTYACDPAINVEAEIREFELYSNKDFNSNFPAGSNLTDIVQFAVPGGFAPFDIFVDNQRNVLKIESTYVRFSEASQQTEAQNFTCKITLTDGRTFDATIENIILSDS